MNGCARSISIALLFAYTSFPALAGERGALTYTNATESEARSSAPGVTKSARLHTGTALDRVAYAVDGAESSHGADLTMWRPDDPSGPQGPMQVSEPAAADVGGGDRFDSTENRAIGRAYLAQLYRRYKNWPDAIAAYNWGMGNVDNWISAGRPADKFVASVAAYLRRVLRESGMCGGARAMPAEPPRGRTLSADRQSGDVTADIQSEVDFVALAKCAELEAWGGMFDEKDRPLFNSQGRFYSKLEKAMVLTMQHLPTSQRSTDGRASASSKSITERR